MFRKLIVIAVPLVAVMAWASSAGAVDVKTADPVADVLDTDTQKRGPGKLDVVSVVHNDDGLRATYVITTKDPFASADVRGVHVYFDQVPGVAHYDCVQIAAEAAFKDGNLGGSLNQCLGSGGGPEGGPGGFKDLGPVTATHTDGTTTLSISFDIASLRNAGFTGDSLAYTVWVAEAKSGRSDDVPNDGAIAQKLSPPPTPRPVPATPAPTAAPTLQPTPQPTPDATAIPTPSATPDLVSFAAPEEASDDDGGPNAPLSAAAAASVVIGAGAAFMVFRPF